MKKAILKASPHHPCRRAGTPKDMSVLATHYMHLGSQVQMAAAPDNAVWGGLPLAAGGAHRPPTLSRLQQLAATKPFCSDQPNY